MTDVGELREAARHMLQHPLTCQEQHPDAFALVRRHEQALDRLLTQRLGYRLQVTGDTARLYKGTAPPHRPILPAPTGRPLSQRECRTLALVLAAVAAGPRIVSLRDLVDHVRTAAVDAEITLGDEPVDRRALITALKWMVGEGLLREVHERIDRYEHDAMADAILEVYPERVSLLPLPALSRSETADELLGDRRQPGALRQYLRAKLVENPVLYRRDLDESEWYELRRRIGEEITMLDELFGLQLETRAEGVAAIDPDNRLSDRPFPATGTIGHAALLLIERIVQHTDAACSIDDVDQMLASLADLHRRHWAKGMLDDLPRLRDRVLDLLDALRLCELSDDRCRLLPAAARFRVVTTRAEDADTSRPTRENDEVSRRRVPGQADGAKEAASDQLSLW